MKNDQRSRLTKRMLREGLFRIMKNKPVSSITVTELCRESGINRATFYKYYDSPIMLLDSVILEYIKGFKAAYSQNREPGTSYEAALEDALKYIYNQKDELKILLSTNGENYLTAFLQNNIKKNLMRGSNAFRQEAPDSDVNEFMKAVVISSGVVSLISVWLLENPNHKPKDIMQILYNTFSTDIFPEIAK